MLILGRMPSLWVELAEECLGCVACVPDLGGTGVDGSTILLALVRSKDMDLLSRKPLCFRPWREAIKQGKVKKLAESCAGWLWQSPKHGDFIQNTGALEIPWEQDLEACLPSWYYINWLTAFCFYWSVFPSFVVLLFLEVKVSLKVAVWRGIFKKEIDYNFVWTECILFKGFKVYILSFLCVCFVFFSFL